MKATVEVFERSTGKVVEVQFCEDLSAFRRYWTKQGNSVDFGYRVMGGSGEPFKRRIVRESLTSDTQDFLPMTDELVAEIAKYNANMTPAEVHKSILDGQAVYTNFNRYRLEA